MVGITFSFGVVGGGGSTSQLANSTPESSENRIATVQASLPTIFERRKGQMDMREREGGEMMKGEERMKAIRKAMTNGIIM